MKKLIFLLISLWTGSLFAQQPNWVPQIYTNSMSIISKIEIENIPAKSGDIVGFFVEEECRGIATLQINNNIAYAIANVQGENVETATCKLYRISDSKILESQTTIQINPGEELGSQTEPYLISFSETATLLFSVSFLVTDISMVPIKNASVSFNSTNQQTNDEGIVVYESIPNGEFGIEISHVDYESVIEKIVISDDIQKEIILTRKSLGALPELNVNTTKGNAPFKTIFTWRNIDLTVSNVLHFGDGESLAISSSQGTYEKVYSRTGLFTAVIYANNAYLVGQTIQSFGQNAWIFKFESLNNYRGADLEPSEIIQNGRAYGNPSLDPNWYKWFHWIYTNDICASAQDFTLIFRAKVPTNEGGISCNDLGFNILTHSGYSVGGAFMSGGCSFYSSIGAGKTWHNGGCNPNGIVKDLSAITGDFSEYRIIKLVVKDKVVKLYLDDELRYTLENYEGELGTIKGLTFAAKGTGSIDYVKLYNGNGEIVFDEDFEDTTFASSICDNEPNNAHFIFQSGKVIGSNTKVSVVAGKNFPTDYGGFLANVSLQPNFAKILGVSNVNPKLGKVTLTETSIILGESENMQPIAINEGEKLFDINLEITGKPNDKFVIEFLNLEASDLQGNLIQLTSLKGEYIIDGISISGSVVTDFKVPLANISVKLDSENSYSSITDEEGVFGLENLSSGMYKITPITDLTIVLDLLDVIAYKDNLTGTKVFASPSEVLKAKNIKADGRIDIAGYITLKQYILGSLTSFYGQNIAYIPKEHNLTSIEVENAEYPTAIEKEFSENIENADFIAFETGNFVSDISKKSMYSINLFNIGDVIKTSSGHYALPFIANETINLRGLQAEIELKAGFNYRFEGGKINLSSNEYRFFENKYRFIFDSSNGKSIFKGDTLFQLITSEKLAFDSELVIANEGSTFKSFAVDNNYNVITIAKSNNSVTSIPDTGKTGDIVLYPNPTTNSLVINCFEKSDITITTITGREVLVVKNYEPSSVLDLELKTGMYLLTVKPLKNAVSKSFKLVIE